jgi:gliding motility-associated-like protein
MINRNFLPLFLLLTTFFFLSPSGKTQSYYSLDFVENKGQWDGGFKFKADAGSGALYIDKQGYTIVQNNPEDFRRMQERLHGHSEVSNDELNKFKDNPRRSFDITLRSHALKVRFVGSAPDPQVEAMYQREGIDNYYLGNDPSKWKTGVKTFSALQVKNLYPGVDVKYYTDNGQMKYDIILKPGADLSKVVLKYDGGDKMMVKNGELIIKTTAGDVKEMAPYAYQVVNGVKTEVNCRYELKGNEVRFVTKNYNKNLELVIDPILIFCTYTGSRSGNWGFTATPGADGSFYAGGIVFSGPGYPITPGAFQSTFAGGSEIKVDVGITRFNPNGTARIYSTYLGGAGDEYPHSLIADPAGNLVVLGRTNSTNFPATGTFGSLGQYDIFVTKFNASGTALIGSLRIGGGRDDGANINPTTAYCNTSTLYNYGDNARSEVELDAANNVYIAASTSSIDFPVLNGFQNTSGGKQDAVVIKLTPTLSSVVFSSYLGGAEDDAGFVLSINPTNGNIYMAGGTGSSNLPRASNTSSGSIDGFISIIPSNGGSLIQTRYFGTASFDMIYGIDFDLLGFPYIMGISLGSWTVTSNVAYSNPGSKQFISKLQPDLSAYVYSTVYGVAKAVPNISPVAFLVDRCENIYISGWGGPLNPCTPSDCFDGQTSGPLGMPITPDAIKNTTDNRDFYFFVMEKDAASQLYGSYFGQTGGEGDHVDGGTSRFDKRGAIYTAICANCLGPTCNFTAPLPTTPGVVAPVNGAANSGSGGECNLAAVKIQFEFQGVIAGAQAAIGGVINDTSGCAPLKVDFTDTVGLAKSYEWNFGDGTPVIRTVTPDISHSFINVGTYRVMMVGIDSSKCIPRDTSYVTIIASADRAVLDFLPVKLPPCEALNYRFDNISVAPPGKPFSTTAFTWDFGDNTPRVTTGNGSVNHTFTAAGTYNVKLVLRDTNYCNYPDSIVKVLRVAPNVDARFTTPPGGCVPYTANFANTSVAGQTFQWDFGDGTNFTGATPPPKIYNTIGTYTITLIAIDPNTCNQADTFRQTITVREGPVANFSFSPNPSQPNTPTQFLNGSIGATTYFWDFGDGDSSFLVNPTHQFNATGDFNTCLLAINQFGCIDTVCQRVGAIVNPLLDVPNAFTPNGDGNNDRVFVRGFGIAKMNFRIYNRQGLMVFQSFNPSNGWDGKYKGVLQPMDVYAYTLEAEFSDGNREARTGNITLLR